jgi:hypothetical protein
MSSTEQTQLGESEQVTLKTDTDTPTLHKPFIRGHVQCGVELYDHATMSRGEARERFDDVRECQAPACYGDAQ